MATAISIQGITKTYPAERGSSEPVFAVNNVSLEIAPGELFFLLGPSGCGKTTLLRMLAGFIEPTSGRILFDGKDVTRTPAQTRQTGMVFQSYALWPHMTVEANVGFGLSVRKTPAAEAAQRIAEALALVQMAEYGKRRPTQLSGGQQQRVALARAIVVRPNILLLDEPLSNLDAKLRADLRQQIRDVCKQADMTAVYVTHDQREALSMADRVAVFNRGRLMQTGTPDEIYRRSQTVFVADFVGELNTIRGTVMRIGPSQIEIETAAGTVFASVRRGVSIGQTVIVGARPESTTISRGSGAAGLRFASRVSRKVFLGEHSVAVAELKSGESWKLLGTGRQLDDLKAGQSISIEADESEILILSAEVA